MRVSKTMLRLLFAACICCTSALANSEQQYDHTASIKINNIDVTKPITHRELRIILNKNLPKFGTVKYSECTGNFDTFLRRAKPKTRLEYYQEDNNAHDLKRFFLDHENHIENSSLRARLWLDWENLKNSHQDIRIGYVKITDSMTITEFSSTFPLSYRNGQSLHNSESGPTMYQVLFGFNSSLTDEERNEEAPPYTPSVQFLFDNGKLKGLKILQGVAC